MHHMFFHMVVMECVLYIVVSAWADVKAVMFI